MGQTPPHLSDIPSPPPTPPPPPTLLWKPSKTIYSSTKPSSFASLRPTLIYFFIEEKLDGKNWEYPHLSPFEFKILCILFQANSNEKGLTPPPPSAIWIIQNFARFIVVFPYIFYLVGTGHVIIGTIIYRSTYCVHTDRGILDKMFWDH